MGKTRPQEAGEVILWNLETGEAALTVSRHDTAALAVCFSPDAKYFASSHNDGTIMVWDSATGTNVTSITGLSEDVHGLVFSPDGKRLLAGVGKTLRLWEVSTGREETVLRGHNGDVHSVAFSLSGEVVASGSEDRTVKTWGVTTSHPPLEILHAGSKPIYYLVFSKDGKRLAWQKPGTLCVADASTGEVILRSNLGYYKLAFVPGSELLAVSSGGIISGDGITFINAGTGQTVEQLTHEQLITERRKVIGFAFSPDGKFIAVGNTAGDAKQCSIGVYDVASGQKAYTLESPGHAVWDVAFSPDSRFLASASGYRDMKNALGLYGGRPGEVKLWDLETRKELYTLSGHRFCVWSVAFSPDGKRLASASGTYQAGEPGEVKVWDMERGKELYTLLGHNSCVFCVAFSPDGKRLVTSDGAWRLRTAATVRLWDAETGTRLLNLRGNRASVYGVAFSPDGKSIASAGEDGTVRIWNAQSPAD
jgi:WD40 repeat protein